MQHRSSGLEKRVEPEAAPDPGAHEGIAEESLRQPGGSKASEHHPVGLIIYQKRDGESDECEATRQQQHKAQGRRRKRPRDRRRSPLLAQQLQLEPPVDAEPDQRGVAHDQA